MVSFNLMKFWGMIINENQYSSRFTIHELYARRRGAFLGLLLVHSLQLLESNLHLGSPLGEHVLYMAIVSGEVNTILIGTATSHLLSPM